MSRGEGQVRLPAPTGLAASSLTRPDSLRRLLPLLGLLVVLVAQGATLTQSALWVLPLLGLLLLGLATALPLAPVLGSLLLLRVVTDGVPSGGTRYSGAIDLSGLVAVALILLAIGLFARRREGLRPTLAVAAGIGLWTMIAVHYDGVSSVTAREGLREASIAAVAVIVINSRRSLDLDACTRIVQFAGAIAAAVALIQFATHTGADVVGQIRSDGTFAHPNDAAVYFAIAAVASLWRFSERGRGRLDAAFVLAFTAAGVVTFSLTGVIAMLVMVLVLALLGGGSRRFKLGAAAVAAAVVVAFLLTSVGSERVNTESATQLGKGAARSTSSVDWRLVKWRHLLHEWRQEPVLGKGLGSTTTAVSESHSSNSQLPHNEYLRYLVETGVVGLGLVLAGILLLMRRLWAIGKAPTRSGEAALGGALMAGLLVDAVAANTLLYTPAAYAAALLLAAICAARPAGERARTAGETP